MIDGKRTIIIISFLNCIHGSSPDPQIFVPKIYKSILPSPTTKQIFQSSRSLHYFPAFLIHFSLLSPLLSLNPSPTTFFFFWSFLIRSPHSLRTYYVRPFVLLPEFWLLELTRPPAPTTPLTSPFSTILLSRSPFRLLPQQ